MSNININQDQGRTSTPVSIRETATASLLTGSEYSKALANLAQLGQIETSQMMTEHVTSPFEVTTPPEKIKKRPDGYDYIKSSWMDKNFKSHSPLYKNTLVHYSEDQGWITIVVALEDRLTGNVELGTGSARIQVKQGAGDLPSFRDIIDKGNNVTAALTKAIKNAQSRFGWGADVYGKREEVPTDEEKARFELVFKELSKLKFHKAQQFKEAWEQLGVDYSEFLDEWQMFIDRSLKLSEPKAGVSNDTKTSDTR